MNTLCADLRETARNNEVALLHALAETSQKVVAERLGVSESTVSRLKSEGQIENMAGLLAALGLKAVRIESETHNPEYIHSLRVLAARGI